MNMLEASCRRGGGRSIFAGFLILLRFLHRLEIFLKMRLMKAAQWIFLSKLYFFCSVPSGFRALRCLGRRKKRQPFSFLIDC